MAQTSHTRRLAFLLKGVFGAGECGGGGMRQQLISNAENIWNDTNQRENAVSRRTHWRDKGEDPAKEDRSEAFPGTTGT